MKDTTGHFYLSAIPHFGGALATPYAFLVLSKTPWRGFDKAQNADTIPSDPPKCGALAEGVAPFVEPPLLGAKQRTARNEPEGVRPSGAP